MKDQKNTWKTIVIVLFVGLSVYFTLSIKESNNTYKSEIKSLKHIKDSLNIELRDRVDKDSILFFLKEQENLNSAIYTLNKKVEKLKKEYDEKKPTNFNSIPIDSNIVILSKYLSEKNNLK